MELVARPFAPPRFAELGRREQGLQRGDAGAKDADVDFDDGPEIDLRAP